ncbi:hypothetical protein GQ457_02G007370 [Hibiscus cannabinus]
MALQGRHLWFTICGKVLIKVPEPSSGPTKTSDFDPGGYTSLSLHGGGTSRRLREGYPKSDPIPYTEVKTSRKSQCYISSFIFNSILFESSKQEYIGMVIHNVIKETHKKGRRRFGVLNMVSLACTPFVKSLAHGTNRSCFEQVNQHPKLHM